MWPFKRKMKQPSLSAEEIDQILQQSKAVKEEPEPVQVDDATALESDVPESNPMPAGLGHQWRCLTILEVLCYPTEFADVFNWLINKDWRYAKAYNHLKIYWDKQKKELKEQERFRTYMHSLWKNGLCDKEFAEQAIKKKEDDERGQIRESHEEAIELFKFLAKEKINIFKYAREAGNPEYDVKALITKSGQ